MAAPMRNSITTRNLPQICSRCLSSASRRKVHTNINAQRILYQSLPSTSSACRPIQRSFTTTQSRHASSPTASEAMERIEQLYENATEEFQIAAEETEGNTVYASDDREAAKAEVEKLQDYYKSVVEGTGYDAEVRDEVRKRAGGRVREIVNAMQALEEKAMEHD